MVIIDKEEQLDQIKGNNTNLNIIPIFLDRNKHSCQNKLSCLIIQNDISKFCIVLNHSQGKGINKDIIDKFLLSSDKILVFNKKQFCHQFPLLISKIIDCHEMEFNNLGELLDHNKFISNTILKYYHDFKDRENVNEIVPLMKLIEYGEMELSVLNKLSSEWNNTNEFFDKQLIPVCLFLEQSGLCIDTNKFNKSFGTIIKDDIVYTEYNPYTITKRITNKHNGINYAALNNENGSKESFISRFGQDGVLVLLDYDSFHVRLIADKLNFELPQTSVHEYFGKQYYNKAELTEEEYKNSKQKTFFNMYSQTREYANIEYFNKLYKFTDELFESINKNECIKTNTTDIKLKDIDNPSASKVLNYYIQCLEMETAVQGMYNIIPIISSLESKMILYTYDSILFDMKIDELKQVKEIREILSYQNKFPMHISFGANLQDMQKLKY